MSRTVNVNFRLDEDIKKKMEQACADMGLSMTAAFTIFAKKVGRMPWPLLKQERPYTPGLSLKITLYFYYSQGNTLEVLSLPDSSCFPDFHG